MSEQLLSESEQRAAQSSRFEQPGERVSAIAHLAFGFAFFLTAVILVGQSHTYKVSENLDFVKIYKYNKSASDRGAALDKIRTHVSGDGKWINDAADADGCRDMINYWWPTISFTPVLPAGCSLRVNFKLGPMEEQFMVKDVVPIDLTGCTAQTHTLVLTLTNSNTGTITTTATMPGVIVTVSGVNKTLSIANPNTVIGYNFKTLSKNFQTCLAKRQALAKVLHDSTECHNGFSSPMCTCVRAFSSRIVSWQSRMSASTVAVKASDRIPMGEVVTRGVERCMQLRRAHDIREPLEKVYARSSALLVFAVALLLNGVFNVLCSYGALAKTMWYSVFFLLYFLAIAFTSLADNNSSGLSQDLTVIVMVVPALVHAAYCVWLHAYSSYTAPSYELPFLHPVTFDICLCALTLYTLVERGVVQTEYLMAETLKCHVVGAVYIAIVWYHCYGRGRDAMETEFVQQGYLILFVVGLLASLSSVVTPYPTKECFQLHWLLPGALTYVAFVNPGWSVHLRMAAKLNLPASSAVYNFNAVAGFLVLFIGSMLLSEFLSEYFQIYGAKKFSWPSPGDPLSYAATRGLIVPTGSIALLPTNL